MNCLINNNEKTSRLSRCSVFLAAMIILLSPLACSSRYRVDFFWTIDEQKRRVKIEQKKYLTDSRLNTPFEKVKLLKGNEAVIIVETGIRGNLAESASSTMFGFDEYIQSVLYIQLPHPPDTGEVTNKSKSFIQVLGRFELPEEEKIFEYSDGEIVIDSINGRKLYISMNAEYLNSINQPLLVEGNIRIKMPR